MLKVDLMGGNCPSCYNKLMLRSYNEKCAKNYSLSRITLGSASFLLVLTILSGLVLSSAYVSADESVVDDINITVPVSCTLSGTGQNSHNAEIANGTYQADIGTTTLHAFCNDNNGFAIYAAGYTGDEIGGTNSNKLVGTSASSNAVIETGLATSAGNPDISNWAMKLAITQDSGDTTGTNAFTIDNGFNSYHIVPNEYVKVAHKNSYTDMTASTGGVKLTTTYAAYISKTQPADTYTGQVKYTLVHPSDAEAPLSPQQATAGCINYFANASNVEGTMGCQSISDSATSATLFASNFSREGYGFAGWSDAYDYATNANANFYGPNEDITFAAGQYTGTNPGLSLYAVWVRSAGNLQDGSKVAELCGTGSTNGSLTAATYDDMGDEDESTWSITAGLSSISALTDTRDNQTYAIAKLTDGNCWMIENLRLDNTAELTTTNTNNPLNDGVTVTFKHNYTDMQTYNTLSASSSVAYEADTAPDGWCTTNSAACDDQSRLRTDNTANRVSYATTATTMSSDANLYSYGNYYNWYSATAGNGTFDNSGNTVGDLCPAGWRLSTGNGVGEFGLLSNSLGGYKNVNNVAQGMSSSTTPTGIIMYRRIRHFPNNFVHSGYVNGSIIRLRGFGGYYWTSYSSQSHISANDLLFINSGYFHPGTYYNDRKNSGESVRCLALPSI